MTSGSGPAYARVQDRLLRAEIATAALDRASRSKTVYRGKSSSTGKARCKSLSSTIWFEAEAPAMPSTAWLIHKILRPINMLMALRPAGELVEGRDDSLILSNCFKFWDLQCDCWSPMLGFWRSVSSTCKWWNEGYNLLYTINKSNKGIRLSEFGVTKILLS